MTRIFSVEKFKRDCRKDGDSEKKIDDYCNNWANKCDGLEEEETGKIGYGVHDDWMEERK